jgi:hypothetical protein
MFIRMIATAALAGLALVQSVATGSLSGKVVDVAGGVIPGAAVTVITGGEERKAITNSEGLYRIEGLPPGKLSVKAVLTGFQVRRADIEIVSGRDATWDVRLGPYFGQSNEPPSGPDSTDGDLSRGVYEALLRYAFRGSVPRSFLVTRVSLVPPDKDDRDWPKELAAVPASVRAATRTVDAQRPVTLRPESLPPGGRLTRLTSGRSTHRRFLTALSRESFPPPTGSARLLCSSTSAGVCAGRAHTYGFGACPPWTAG